MRKRGYIKMDINYTEVVIALITAIIGVLGMVITKVLVPYLKTKKEEVEATLTKEQRETIRFWTSIAVVAFEKRYEDEIKQGTVKKDLVMKFIKSLGLNIEDHVLSVLVDAIVEELINKPIIEYIDNDDALD